jgi:hypothetical protein
LAKRPDVLLRQTRKLQEGLKSVPDHVLTGAPEFGLNSLEQRLQDWLSLHAALGGPFFSGRNEYYRDLLYEALLAEWVDTLGGQLSFARDQYEQPYGPLIDFLSITLKAILGRAPGPSGIAKIIDKYR